GNSYDNTGALSATSWRHVKFVEQFPADAEPGGRVSPPVLASRERERPEGNPPVAHAPGSPQGGRWLMMSDVCNHCVEARCQQACPTGSLIQNEMNNVYVQPDICNGCAYCVAACPFGVLTRSPADGHAHKCALCFDRQRDGLTPACAKACPTQ